MFVWNYCKNPDSVDDYDLEVQERWSIVRRHYFMQSNAKVRCSAFHSESNLLVVGFSNGVFGLYGLPEFSMIHTLR